MFIAGNDDVRHVRYPRVHQCGHQWLQVQQSPHRIVALRDVKTRRLSNPISKKRLGFGAI